MATGPSEDSNNQTEALELYEYGCRKSTSLNDPPNTADLPRQSWLGKRTSLIKVFWSRQVVVEVPHDACRDHFGTFPPRPIRA